MITKERLESIRDWMVCPLEPLSPSRREIKDFYALALLGLDAQWQPIETAPRDGTWVFIAGGGLDSGAGPFHRRRGVWIACFNKWQWDTWGAAGRLSIHAPTHWMPLPLPQPPKES